MENKLLLTLLALALTLFYGSVSARHHEHNRPAVADTLRPDTLPTRPDPDQVVMEPVRPVLTDTSRVGSRQSWLGRMNNGSGLSRKYRPSIRILAAIVAVLLLIGAFFALRYGFQSLSFLFTGSASGVFALLLLFFQLIIGIVVFLSLGAGIGAIISAAVIVREFVLNHKPPKSPAR